MKNYQEFKIKLNDGSNCDVRYCKMWAGSKMKGCLKCKNCEWDYRTDHFEFLNNLKLSETGYLSHFINLNYNDSFDPIEASIEIANSLAGENINEPIQQYLF
jgi:hypothetical protein